MKIRTRKLIGMIGLVGGLVVYAIAFTSLLSRMMRPPLVLECILYVIGGIVWIFAARPLLIWIETGAWRISSQETLKSDKKVRREF